MFKVFEKNVMYIIYHNILNNNFIFFNSINSSILKIFKILNVFIICINNTFFNEKLNKLNTSTNGVKSN